MAINTQRLLLLYLAPQIFQFFLNLDPGLCQKTLRRSTRGSQRTAQSSKEFTEIPE